VGCGVFRTPPPAAPPCPAKKPPPAAAAIPGRSTVYAANGFGIVVVSPTGLTSVVVAAAGPGPVALCTDVVD